MSRYAHRLAVSLLFGGSFAAAGAIGACGSSGTTPEPGSGDASVRDSSTEGGAASDATFAADAGPTADASAADGSGGDAGDGAAGEAGLPGEPGAIHGFKLQCAQIPDAGADAADTEQCASPFRFETGGLDYADAVAGFAAKKLEDIVIKVCDIKDSSSDQCPLDADGGPIDQATRNAAIVEMVQAFKNATDPTNPAYVAGYSPRIYLWERIWMWNHGALTTGDSDFATDMSGVITALVDQNLDSIVRGVGNIENQLPDTESTLDEAEKVATLINQGTGNWLTRHTLLFPGSGDGAWFDSIDRQPSSAAFFANMAGQVNGFAFIFKNMPVSKNCTGANDGGEDNPLCAKGYVGGGDDIWKKYSQDFVECLTKEQQLTTPKYHGNFDCTTDEGKKAYLLTSSSQGGLGLADLQTFLASDCGLHPSLANVLFWGDSGDAFAEMSASNVRVLHQILVDDAWPAAAGAACADAGFELPASARANQFSHRSVVPQAPLDKDTITHILVVDDAGLAKNPAPATPASGAYTSPLDVWQQWNLWTSPTPPTCAAGSPCY